MEPQLADMFAQARFKQSFLMGREMDAGRAVDQTLKQTELSIRDRLHRYQAIASVVDHCNLPIRTAGSRPFRLAPAKSLRVAPTFSVPCFLSLPARVPGAAARLQRFDHEPSGKIHDSIPSRLL